MAAFTRLQDPVHWLLADFGERINSPTGIALRGFGASRQAFRPRSAEIRKAFAANQLSGKPKPAIRLDQAFATQ
jgi:hypothetical protein